MSRRSLCLLIVSYTAALGIAETTTAPAKQTKQAKEKTARQPNPAFASVTDNPALPRVLLIGDSISMGYTVASRKALAGVANVHRPATNCGPTTNGLANIDAWLGEKPWDVIHFNWGLHDLKYMGPNKKNLANPSLDTSYQQVPPDQYELNLRELVARLEKTGAVLIWRNTTPVPVGARGRVPGDSAKYNEIATKVMRAHGIAIHDMFSFCHEHPDLQLPRDVHFSTRGSQQLAITVAEHIKSAFEKR